jgi:hypothetical protein
MTIRRPRGKTTATLTEKKRLLVLRSSRERE